MGGPSDCTYQCGNSLGNLPLRALLAMEVGRAKAHLLAPGEIGMKNAFTEVTTKVFQSSIFRGYDVPKTHEALKKQWDSQLDAFNKRQAIDTDHQSHPETTKYDQIMMKLSKEKQQVERSLTLHAYIYI